jgi:hypothetical protein
MQGQSLFTDAVKALTTSDCDCRLTGLREGLGGYYDTLFRNWGTMMNNACQLRERTYNKPMAFLKPWFGDRAGQVQLMLAGVSAVTVGASAGVTFAKNFIGDPQFRWFVAGILFLLFAGGYYSGRRSRSVRRARRTTLQNSIFFWMGLAMLGWLVCDVGITFSGYYAPVAIKALQIQYRSSGGFALRDESAKMKPDLLAAVATAASLKLETGRPSSERSFGTPDISFILAHKSDARTLVIENVELLVDKFESYSEPPTEAAKAMVVLPPTECLIVLSRQSSPPPWSFQPTAVNVAGTRHAWQPGILKMEDETEVPFGINVRAVDAGTYIVRLQLTVRTDFGTSRPITVFKNKRFMFYRPATKPPAAAPAPPPGSTHVIITHPAMA